MIENDLEPSIEYSTLFTINLGNANMTKVILSHGANINILNRSGRSALHVASENGDEENVNVLIENGANLNIRDKFGLTAMHLAATNGQIQRFLMRFGRCFFL